MVPVIVAALWGSSWHQVSGPINTISLTVFASLAPLAVPGSVDHVRLALTLALMVGLVQLAMGLARLGWLGNFIPHTVIVALTAGAGLLIIAAQLRTFFGIDVAGCELVAREANAARVSGIALYAANLKPRVHEALERAGSLDTLGRERVFPDKGVAIRAIYATLDVPTCRACAVRVFDECARFLPDGSPRDGA